MKCPNCDHEVPKGSLFCPNCLTEVPWVKEFDTVETQMNKKNLEEARQNGSDQEDPETEELYRLDQISIRTRLTTMQKVARILPVVLIVVALAVMVLVYQHTHTFTAIFLKAERAYQEGDLDRALSTVQDALQQKPESLKANLLMAETLDAMGDQDSAIMVLQPLVEAHPDSTGLYLQLCDLYLTTGRQKELRALLRDVTSEKVLSACGVYMCDPPVSSPDPDTYYSAGNVELSAGGNRIYYTINGDKPTESSYMYADPVPRSEGTMEIRTFAVNELGVHSDTVSYTYVTVLDTPDPPVITPESGSYSEDIRIEIQVPDGCKAYYAFDEVPTTGSTEYKSPITMPQGEHTLYAILVAGNGRQSETAQAVYQLEY